MRTFEEAWKEKEAQGFRYGEDALEQVKLGWQLRQDALEENLSTVEPPQPIMVTVDYLFVLLDKALGSVVEHHGDDAKAIAWDVHGHFVRELGNNRAGGLIGS